MKSSGRDEGASSRRGFLTGLLVGVSAMVTLGLNKAKAVAGSYGKKKEIPEPILFRRTEEAERYYRTLY